MIQICVPAVLYLLPILLRNSDHNPNTCTEKVLIQPGHRRLNSQSGPCIHIIHISSISCMHRHTHTRTYIYIYNMCE